MDELAKLLYRAFGERRSRRGFLGAVGKAIAGSVALGIGGEVGEAAEAHAQLHTGTPPPSLLCCSGNPCFHAVCPAFTQVSYTWYCIDPSTSNKVKCSDCFYAPRKQRSHYACTYAQVTSLT